MPWVACLPFILLPGKFVAHKFVWANPDGKIRMLFPKNILSYTRINCKSMSRDFFWLPSHTLRLAANLCLLWLFAPSLPFAYFEASAHRCFKFRQVCVVWPGPHEAEKIPLEWLSTMFMNRLNGPFSKVEFGVVILFCLKCSVHGAMGNPYLFVCSMCLSKHLRTIIVKVRWKNVDNL